jgi:hypothetical protein
MLGHEIPPQLAEDGSSALLSFLFGGGVAPSLAMMPFSPKSSIERDAEFLT